jgi:lauroyl/myristoyl acyltransferase
LSTTERAPGKPHRDEAAAPDKAPRPAERGERGEPRGLKRLRYRVEAFGLGLAESIIPKLSRDMAYGLAGIIGWIAYVTLPEDRRVAYANLDIVFGDAMPRTEKRRIVRGTFHNTVANAVGLFWSPRVTADNVRDYVDVDESNRQWFHEIQARGHGVIFITPHYGDWELLNLASGFLGAKYTTVMEPTKNPAIEQSISRLRSRSGHVCVHPRFAVVKLFKAVSRGETVGILIDVNARRGRGGVWLDFFGLPVFNSAAVAELAMRTGAAIVFAAAHPLPGRRIRIQFGPEVLTDNTGDKGKDVLSTSQRCLDECAKVIREKPEHWLWTYKRWKRRPSPDKGRFPFYSKYDPNT